MSEVVCTVCPNGCALNVTQQQGGWTVRGNLCPRGEAFAKAEMTDPERTLTTTVRVVGGDQPLASVRTLTPVKKNELFALMKTLNGIALKAPVQVGQTVLNGFGKNKVTVIATRNVANQKETAVE